MSRNPASFATRLILALALVGPVALPVRAADDAAAEPPAPLAGAPLDPRATAVMERMAQRLVAAASLRVRGEIAWDVVQPDGRTLEFGASREVLLRRPDRLRVEIAFREGGEHRIFYDGTRIVVHDLEHQVYATAARSGPIDGVIAYVSGHLGIPVALAELLSPDLPALLLGEMQSADYVSAETIDGVRCDHVSLRNEVGSLELWIAEEDALPRRITIHYEHEEGQPQFRARFTDWDLSPRAPDSTFAFDPPQGVERIAFALQGEAPAQEDPR